MENLVTIPANKPNKLRSPDNNFWQGKRVLLTGHTGFKGSWLAFWLAELGAEVIGLSLAPETQPNLFDAAAIATLVRHEVGDIRDENLVTDLVRETRPNIVFHLAAQALVRRSYAQPVGTFATNVMGTVNILEAIAKTEAVRVGVMITTDKVYENREWIYPYRENEALGGHDPYSASKAACEIAIASYRASFFKKQTQAVASARAGNVIGGGDWSQNRLIPDAVRAWQNDQTLSLRFPQAVRPWQHVIEPLNAYILLAEQLWSNSSLADAYNIGPDSAELASVIEVISLAQQAFGRGTVATDGENGGLHEAGLLALDNNKARTALGIEPRWGLKQGIEKTMAWYRDFAQGANARDLCFRDLRSFGGLS